MTDRRRLDRIARLRAWLIEPRDASAIAVFRIAFGCIVFISALRFLWNGWVDEFFVRPAFRFRYWGFGWLPDLPPIVIHGLFVALAVLGALVAVGLCYRAAVGLLFPLFTYLQLIDVANYLNHYYLVSLFAALLFFIPANRALSLDARLRPGIRADSLPMWCTVLLRFQVTIVYVNAGLGKATTDWLLHAQPLNIWLSARTHLPLIGQYLDLPAVAYVAAWCGFLFDATIALFLSARKTRSFAYAAVLGFHFLTHVLFPPIGMFPVIMVVSALVFFESSWPRDLVIRVRRITRCTVRCVGTSAVAERQPAEPRTGGRWSEVGAVAAAVFLLLQMLVPLRGHVYGGNVLWHEQGMRFSWRVMARTKSGSVTFVVRDQKSGRVWHVPPTKYLTRLQEREMAVQPDLILQLACRIARDFEDRGYPGVEVRADAWASLNGRPAERLIDPHVDLAREKDGFAGKAWITQAPTAAPPHLRSLARFRDL